MAGAKYLLDTVIVAGYFNRDAAILKKMSDATVYVSSTTIGELYFGAYNSGKTQQNIQNIQQFSSLISILVVDENTANWYGKIKKALRAKGRPIPENDIWIAASAMQHGLILATRDAHFNQVENLTIDIW